MEPGMEEHKPTVSRPALGQFTANQHLGIGLFSGPPMVVVADRGWALGGEQPWTKVAKKSGDCPRPVGVVIRSAVCPIWNGPCGSISGPELCLSSPAPGAPFMCAFNVR
ncbi:hypothetical protein GN956_G19545 [Arapaima gigas]